jgi:ATP-dependent Clp endopeptidase proteolytic subunit ClpP
MRNLKRQQLSDVIEGAVNEAIQIPMLEPQMEDIMVVENTIYFYSEVTSEKILKLIKTVNDIDNINQIYKITRRQDKLDPIYLHINSEGGSLLDGLLAMDKLLKTKSEIITIVDGMSASAATLIAMVGSRRLINKHSYMLIHQLSTGVKGTYHNLVDETDNCDKLMKSLEGLYLKYTKIPKNKLKELLEHDLLLSAEECLKYGIVDEII